MPPEFQWFVVLSFVAILAWVGLILIWIVLCNPEKRPRIPIGVAVRGFVLGFTFLAGANYTFANMFLDDTLHQGSVESGKAEHGRYFVGDRGRYHEVSEPFYRLVPQYKLVSGCMLVAGILGTVVCMEWARHTNRR